MNFLAHLYLSKEDKNLIIGNFIADAVKGNRYMDYPEPIRQGIVLHRHIDSYTDKHPIARKSRQRLHERYGHYKGVIIDILYDHFLAKNWHRYSQIPLDLYAESIYKLLQENKNSFPEKINYMLPYLIEHNWLYAYRSRSGIASILRGMNNRTRGLSHMDLAIEDLEKHYDALESDFTSYFELLERYTTKKIQNLRS